MATSAPRLLKVSPPIHTHDPGSPPPESILLDPFGYLSCRVNSSTAEGSTRDGDAILVTFWVATPPRVSCFTVHCPDLKPSAFDSLPKVIYSEDDLVLLRVPFIRRDDQPIGEDEDNQFFVYQAGAGTGQPPSLTRVPFPRGLMFRDREVALLRYRDQDMFYLALLCKVLDFDYDDQQFDLHLYNSKTGGWSIKLMRIDSPKNLISFSYASMAIAIGGEFGSVGWVDLWRGMLICDVLRDSNGLRYLPLPSSLVRKPLTGYPFYFRDIIVVEDHIKFFEMSYHVRPGSNAPQGLVAATKKMKISDVGSGNGSWEKDCSTIKFSEILVDSLKFAQMLLPNLKPVAGAKLTLKTLQAGYPALSLHDAYVVYIMHKPDPDKNKASVIAIDMRNKTIKDVAPFGSGRPLGYTFTYLQSGISKYMNIWSSSRSSVNADATSRDGVLGPSKLEVPGKDL